MKKILCYALVILGLSGCTYIKDYYSYQREQQTVTTNHYNLPYFDSIVASGKIYVEINKGAQAVSSAAQKQYNDKVTTRVAKRTLYVSYPPALTQQNIAVLISLPNLKSLHAENNAYVITKNLLANNLEITVDSRASINLIGTMNIKKIVQKSDGKIEALWINSKKLTIEGYGHGLMLLAGKTKELFAKLCNNSQLDARHLRTKTATIIATNTATAHVWVSDLLNAYTDKQSNVYYYRISAHRNIVSKNNSNVLYWDWIQ